LPCLNFEDFRAEDGIGALERNVTRASSGVRRGGQGHRKFSPFGLDLKGGEEVATMTTESGNGSMFNGDRRTQVGVFFYDPFEIDDEDE